MLQIAEKTFRECSALMRNKTKGYLKQWYPVIAFSMNISAISADYYGKILIELTRSCEREPGSQKYIRTRNNTVF
jgi:hypothetical protein